MAVKIAGKQVTAAHAATGGTGIVLVGIAAEALRLYSQASAKASMTLGVAKDKAVEAGALEKALDACIDQQEVLQELLLRGVQL